MYETTDIERMDFKQLRRAVQAIYDALMKFKREYEDTIENIDFDNLSGNIRKKLDGYETQIKIAAGKIESKVSYEDLKKSMDTVITQTADKVSIVAERIDETQTEAFASLTVTADKIESTVSKTVTTYFESDRDPNSRTDITEAQKGMLCKVGNDYYYYSGVTETWKKADGQTVATKFVQTADGFYLTGDVKVDGDLITEGSITGDKIQANTITADKINTNELYAEAITSGNHFSEPYHLKVTSNLGDIGVFKGKPGAVGTTKDPSCIWGVYNKVDAIDFYASGTCYGGFNLHQQKYYPKSTWKFTSCNVEGLYVNVGGMEVDVKSRYNPDEEKE